MHLESYYNPMTKSHSYDFKNLNGVILINDMVKLGPVILKKLFGAKMVKLAIQWQEKYVPFKEPVDFQLLKRLDHAIFIRTDGTFQLNHVSTL
jgi:hypothetical protein